jgi:hypothetical protein
LNLLRGIVPDVANGLSKLQARRADFAEFAPQFQQTFGGTSDSVIAIGLTALQKQYAALQDAILKICPVSTSF